MQGLSEKELSGINDMLAAEGLLIKKFQLLADMASDPDIRKHLGDIVAIHQSHFNQIYDQLS